MIRFTSLAASALVLLAVEPAASRTWHLAPDGSGDAATIQAAIEQAAPGDVIQLDCGTFHEGGVQMRSGLVLRGVSRDCTTIEGDGAATLLTCNTVHDASIEELDLHGAGLLLDISGSALDVRRCSLRGIPAWAPPWSRGIRCASTALTLRECRLSGFYTWEQYGSAGPAMLCSGSNVTILDCDIESNRADGGMWWSSGRGAGLHAASCAVVIRGSRYTANLAGPEVSDGGAVMCQGCSPVDISETTFESNRSGNGGAIALQGCADVRILACTFRQNHAGSGGGALWLEECAARVEGCVLTGNDAEYGGAICGRLVAGMEAEVVRCTLHANSAADGSGVCMIYQGTLRLEDSIVVFGGTGAAASAVVDYGAAVLAVCTDTFGNEGGDWVGPLEGQSSSNGNLGAWPLFCWAEGGDLHLGTTSPCLPAHNACGVQMGALGVGCGPVPVTPMTWGRIKGLYR